MKKLIFLILCTPLSIFGQKQAVLVKNGQAVFTISIMENASKTDEDAAFLLQTAIRKMSGAELKIVRSNVPNNEKTVWITSSPFFILPDGFKKHYSKNGEFLLKNLTGQDAFGISVQKDNILILGRSKKGSYYGVVHLLEKYLGCRVYAPDAEIMPQKATISLPIICEMDKPVNGIRIVNGVLTQQNEAYRNWQRLNDHNEEFAKGYYVHTFDRLVPWETHFETHPEYFALMNGKRLIDQLCLTHPDVYDLTIKKLKEEMAKQPEKTLWSVSQGDNFSYCQCDKCAKIIADEGSAAGPIIHFVNKVAAQFPDKMISTLAYQYSRKAPKHVKPADNVQIMLCTIELNRSKNIENDPLSKSFLKDITDWGAISKNIYLWDYTVNFSHHITPFPNLHTLQKNIQFFTKNSVNAHFQQTNASIGHEFSELKAYLIARLLWNPNVKADSVMTDFLTGYYGAGGVFIQKYINHLTAEIQKTGEWLDIYGHPMAHAKTFLSAENRRQYNQYFDEAENAVKNDPSVLQRVKVCRLPLQYATLEIGKSDMFGASGFYTENNGKFILKPEMQQLIEDFYTVCKQNKVLGVNEAGLTTEAYYQATKRFINVQVEGNLAFRKKTTANPTPSLKYSHADLAILTNGVQGANDFKAHWLGWQAQDFDLILDLETAKQPKSIQISTLYDQRSWILHPKSVTCSVSEDGKNYRLLETQTIEGDQRKENVTRNFSFDKNIGTCRYIKFEVKGTGKLFNWHPSAGGGSWVFVDEIVVRDANQPLPNKDFYKIRNGLKNSFSTLNKGEKTTVAFLGGSITYSKGWRDKTCAYLKEAFPKTDFRFINAGIPSLGSLPHAFRLQRDLLDSGKIDLLFVEAAVNDRANGTDSLTQIQALEGIIRHAKTANPNMDIVLMSFADPDKTQDYDNGKEPIEVKNHELVAAHYQLPSINLAKEVRDRMANKEFSWKADFKDLHPSVFGQELYFSAIKTLLNNCFDDAKTLKDNILENNFLNKSSFINGKYYAIENAQLDANWTLDKNWKPTDGLSTREGFVNVPMLVSTKSESALSLNFKGTAVGISIVSGADVGIISYSIDGAPFKNLDLFTRWSGQLHLPWYLILDADLPQGNHVLKLKISSEKNPKSKGYVCRIVHFLVNE